MTPLLFSLPANHPMAAFLCESLNAQSGVLEQRLFPDGETYLKLNTDVQGRDIIVLADLSHPDSKFLPLSFLAAELRDSGATRIGLVAPYLSYMRQDKRFQPGEVLTSKHFARLISQQFDWLVTIDPHLHRYRSLSEIYSIPGIAVSGSPVIANWLAQRNEALLLVGPDEESRQWVGSIARLCDCPFLVGSKIRRGDRDVVVDLPDTTAYLGATAILIDDVISSGNTLLRCAEQLRSRGFSRIEAVAVHGLFAERSDHALLEAGITPLSTGNSVINPYSVIDLTPVLYEPVRQLMNPQDPCENTP